MKKGNAMIFIIAIFFVYMLFFDEPRKKDEYSWSGREYSFWRELIDQHMTISVHGENGVSLNLPKDWSVRCNDKVNLLIYGLVGDKKNICKIDITSGFVGEVALEDCHAHFIEGLKYHIKNVNILEQKKIKILDRDAMWTVFTCPYSNHNIKYDTYVIVHKKWAYEIICTASDKEYEQAKQVFKNIINSIKITKQDSKPDESGEGDSGRDGKEPRHGGLGEGPLH